MREQNNIWKWLQNNPVKAIIITGLFIRLFVAIVYQHITLYPDSNDYITLAERILSLNFPGYEGERSPGYPLLLSISNISVIATAILQSIIGICTLIIMYKTLLLIGIKQQLSLIIALLTNLYLPIVFFEFAILSETLTLFVISLTFFFLFKIINSDDKKKGDIFGLILSCTYLVLIKPFYIFLPFILFLFLLTIKKKFKTNIIKYSFILVLPLTVFLGWSYVNKINTGYFVSTTFYGFNLAQNCVMFAEHTSPEYREIGETYARYRDNRISDKEIAMTIWEAYPELQEKTGLSFPDLSKKLYDYSIETIKLNPAKYLKQVFVSWCDFWKTSFYWESHNMKLSLLEKPTLYFVYAERILLQLIKILFVLLIPVNIWWSIKKRQLSPSLIISVVVLSASILQALVTYGTNSRFSFPFEVLIIISVLFNVKMLKDNLSELFKEDV